MTEEASIEENVKNEILLENEAIKETIKKVQTKNSGLKYSISSFILIIFCSFLLVISTFVQLNIIHFSIPFDIFSGKNLNIQDYIHHFNLIPQIPAVMFVTGLLGRKFGLTSVIIYILAGLFFIPIFALGGGLNYFGEYGFGYILAYIPAVYLTGKILKKGYTYKNVIKAVMVGILTIHIVGILYMLMIAGFKHEGFNFIIGWIVAQSGVKILYDFILSFFAVLVAKYARIILWLYM